MSEQFIKYSGTGYPVPLGSEIELKFHHERDLEPCTGRLVTYESFLHSGHEAVDKTGFYWKIYDGVSYYNFANSAIESYRIINSTILESSIDELTICKDLIWLIYHDYGTEARLRGIHLLRREYNLRNSEICELLGLKSKDIDFILENRKGE